MTPRKIITTAAVALACALLAACGLAQQASTGHHAAAKARASHAVTTVRSNPAVQADVNAATQCAVGALAPVVPGVAHPTLHDRAREFRSCMRLAFPKGGSARFVFCAGQAFLLHGAKGIDAVKPALTVCGRRFR